MTTTLSRPTLRALLVVAAACLVGSQAGEARPMQTGSSTRSCFRTRSVLVYTSRPGNHPTGVTSGTRVTFRRGRRGWTGVSVDPSAPAQRPTVLQDLLLDAARGQVYYLVPRRSGDPLIVQGRIDCDSLWGTSRPRYSKQEPAPIVLRRVRMAR